MLLFELLKSWVLIVWSSMTSTCFRRMTGFLMVVQTAHVILAHLSITLATSKYFCVLLCRIKYFWLGNLWSTSYPSRWILFCCLFFRLWYKEIVGGVLAMTMNDFRTVNGYSNMYWSWGGEDDDMGNLISISCSQFFPLLSTTFILPTSR